MGEFAKYLRYDLPLWLMRVLTCLLPDIGPMVRLRGMLFKPFIGKCGRNFTVGRDVTIRLPSRVSIGDNVYIAKGCWLEATGRIEIDDEVMLAPYVVVVTSTHGFRDGSVHGGGVHLAPVRIGKGTWVAAHAVIVGGVRIGAGNLVGANAVVTKDTEDNVFVGGVPARVIAPREDDPSDVTGRQGTT